MLNKTIRENVSTSVAIKFMYYFAKVFGLANFTITRHGLLKSSHQTSFILYRITVLTCLLVLLPKYFNNQFSKEFIWTISLLQSTSMILFNVGTIIFQILQSQAFLTTFNKAINTVGHITVLTKAPKIFGYEFTVVISWRLISSFIGICADYPRIISALRSEDILIFPQICSAYFVWMGSVVVINFLYFMFISAAGVYKTLGNHMASFAERIEMSQEFPMKTFRRRQLLREFCDELDECSAMYSKIFKIISEFHSMMQFFFLFAFYFYVVMTIGSLHVSFVYYMKNGEILWHLIVMAIVLAFEMMFLMLLVDLTIRRSKKPQSIAWESLYSDIDSRWDQCVDRFVSQLQFEELKIEVCGLFQVNNELCLRLISLIVAYLTILIQFTMTGNIDFIE